MTKGSSRGGPYEGMMTAYRELIVKGIRHPERIPSFLYQRTIGPAVNGARYEYHRRSAGIPRQRPLIDDLISQDEFALVVLDACRFDYFQRQYDAHLEGTLERVWSPANQTPEWVPQVWDSQYDATYVSANPYIGNFEFEKAEYAYCAGNHFREVLEAWDFGWEFDLRTTPPDVVTDVALEVAARSPETRLVAHYIQPHQPYIGNNRLEPWDTDTSQDPAVSERERETFLNNVDEVTEEEIEKYQISWGDKRKYDLVMPDSKGVRQLVAEDRITNEDLHRAYRDNLELVLEEVDRLVTYLNCPVIITSDHGDLLGENGDYMHPDSGQAVNPILREVPWLVVDEDTIGKKPNEPQTSYLQAQRESDTDVEERLANLGYR